MTSATKPNFILWDVVEEHFNEAEFVFGQWERALRSPAYNLNNLRKRIEQRLEAHLDALLLGGRQVAEGLLYEELGNTEEPARAKAAALALSFDDSSDTARQILEATLRAEEPLQTALSRAISLANVPHVDAVVLDRFHSATSQPVLAILLEILTKRGVDSAYQAQRYLDADHPRLAAAALAAASRFARRDAIPAAEKQLEAADPYLRKAALIAGAILGSRAAWDICLQLAERPGTFDPEIQSMVATLGCSSDHEILYHGLANPTRLQEKIWVLGFCGTASAGDLCVGFLKSGDERTAKAAADSLAWISGFALIPENLKKSDSEPQGDTALPLLEQDLNADLTLTGLDEIGMPNAERIADSWEAMRSRLVSGQRYILGRPFSGETIMHALRTGALWRRHAIALDLAARTAGMHHVSTDAFSSRQSSQIAALEGTDLALRTN